MCCVCTWSYRKTKLKFQIIYSQELLCSRDYSFFRMIRRVAVHGVVYGRANAHGTLQDFYSNGEVRGSGLLEFAVQLTLGVDRMVCTRCTNTFTVPTTFIWHTETVRIAWFASVKRSTV